MRGYGNVVRLYMIVLSNPCRLWAPDPQDVGPGPVKASVCGPNQGAQVDGSGYSSAEARPLPAAPVCRGRGRCGRVQWAGPSPDAQPRHRPAEDHRGEAGNETWKFTHYLLTTMQMEGWVKCLSPQNTSGVSGVNSWDPEEDLRGHLGKKKIENDAVSSRI